MPMLLLDSRATLISSGMVVMVRGIGTAVRMSSISGGKMTDLDASEAPHPSPSDDDEGGGWDGRIGIQSNNFQCHSIPHNHKDARLHVAFDWGMVSAKNVKLLSRSRRSAPCA